MDDVAKIIEEWTRDHGYPPSYDDLAAQLGVSKATAWRRVKKMVDDGLIEQAPHMPRTVRVVGKTEGWEV